MRHGTKPLKSVTDDDLNITILSINGKVNALSKSQATTELRKDKRLAKAMDKGLLEVVNSESDIPMGAELFSSITNEMLKKDAASGLNAHLGSNLAASHDDKVNNTESNQPKPCC
jgi:hypothetical protein